MPIYTYRCQNCDKIFEIMQKMTDAPISSCEICGSEVKKVIQPAGIIFKGSGFYKTDYGSGNGKSKKNEAKQPANAVQPPCATSKCDGACPAINN